MEKYIKIALFSLGLLIFSLPVLASDPFSNPAEIDVRVRDHSGNLLKDVSFIVYHQVKDADGKKMIGKKVASGNTGNLGKKVIKVNVKSFIERGEGDRFVFRIYTKESKNKPFYFWDYVITNNTHPTKTFRLSSVKVTLNSSGSNILENTKFSLFIQYIDTECHCAQKKIIHSSTLSKGCKELFLPEGDYILEVPIGRGLISKREFHIFPNKRTNLDYKISSLQVSIRNYNNKLLPKAKFEIYKQSYDIDNNVIFGKKIGSYDTGTTGTKNVLLPGGVYIVRFFGDGKQVYDLYDQELTTSGYRTIDYKLSSLKVNFYNKSGNKKSNTVKGSIYQQKLDELGNPFAYKKLVNFKINTNRSQSFNLPYGRYVIAVGKDTNFNIEILENKTSEFVVTRNVEKFSYKFLSPQKQKSPVIQFIYGKKRLGSLVEEQRQAIILKQELEAILGRGRIGVPKQHWHILVNSYIYGEYSPAEIADTITSGPQAVHPSIVAPSWRKSNDYKKYLKRVK
ncbi:hypothetical protein HOD96_01080 [Candidatus Falkowbacteria bacterium]|jgi:hypothetical protein|nr:hypothetical protein [Candidatus Falkowbacteria bacterium]MBT4433374.1 hypothetical protein [Candidatus Falkowbacteria bacterium]